MALAELDVVQVYDMVFKQARATVFIIYFIWLFVTSIFRISTSV